MSNCLRYGFWFVWFVGSGKIERVYCLQSNSAAVGELFFFLASKVVAHNTNLYVHSDSVWFSYFFPWRLPLSLANLWKWFEVPVFVLLPRHQWVGKVWRRKVNIERNHKGEGWRNFRGKFFQADIITWHLNQDFTNKNYKYVSICDQFQTFQNWLELFVCSEFNFSLKSWELNVEGGWSVAKSEFNSQNVWIVWVLDQFHIFDSDS